MKGEKKLNYLEIGFQEIEDLMDKHKKTLEERSSQKEFYSELHRLLDTSYIVYHLEYVAFKGSTDYKRMSEKEQDFYASRWKEIPDRCKKELENYERNRSIDQETYKALDGLYNGEKVSPSYAFILKCNLISDWEDPSNLKYTKQAYKDRKKFR